MNGITAQCHGCGDTFTRYERMEPGAANLCWDCLTTIESAKVPERKLSDCPSCGLRASSLFGDTYICEPCRVEWHAKCPPGYLR